MSANRSLIEQCYRIAEGRQYERFAEVFSWDVEFAMSGMTLRGVDQIQAVIEGYGEAFPDMSYKVLDTVESGDTIAVRLLTQGTHTGVFRTPGGELAPTGKTLAHESVDWITVAEGKVARWRVYMDQLEFLAQLGLAPEAADV